MSKTERRRPSGLEAHPGPSRTRGPRVSAVGLRLGQQLQLPDVDLVRQVELCPEADVHVGADQQVPPRGGDPDQPVL
eukprot:4133354-Pyramimonas_sp.AAC.1